MPCRDYGGEMASERDDTKERLDKVTRLLCELMTKIEKSEKDETPIDSYDFLVSKELDQWWAEHKKNDLLRICREEEEKFCKTQDRITKIQNLGGIPGQELASELEASREKILWLRKEYSLGKSE